MSKFDYQIYSYKVKKDFLPKKFYPIVERGDVENLKAFFQKERLAENELNILLVGENHLESAFWLNSGENFLGHKLTDAELHLWVFEK